MTGSATDNSTSTTSDEHAEVVALDTIVDDVLGDVGSEAEGGGGHSVESPPFSVYGIEGSEEARCARPTVLVSQSMRRLGADGNNANVGSVEEDVHAPGAIGPVDGLGPHDDANPSASSVTTAATDVVHTASPKTACLDLRVARILLASSGAAEDASNAYGSVLVLSEHANANHFPASDSARHTSDLSAAVLAQAGAIVTAVQTVATLDTSMECRQKERASGERLPAALYEAIQAGDGGLSQDLRQAADNRRRESTVADAAVTTEYSNASAFRYTCRDPRPADNTLPQRAKGANCPEIYRGGRFRYPFGGHDCTRLTRHRQRYRGVSQRLPNCCHRPRHYKVRRRREDEPGQRPSQHTDYAVALNR